MMDQIRLVTEELAVLKEEVVSAKAAHASLHQNTVQANQGYIERFNNIENRINGIGNTAIGTKPKNLIEPKQITVGEFAGSVTDNRARFLEWAEKVRDRIELWGTRIAQVMGQIQRKKEPISAEESKELGLSELESTELHSFLKEHTKGTAASIVRANKPGVGLESWRLLNHNFNAMTLQGTIAAQHLESYPRGASRMADVPQCLLEWEENLRRCIQEQRTPPSDEAKRFALLRILPKKQKDSLSEVADDLFPTFSSLLVIIRRWYKKTRTTDSHRHRWM